MQGCRMLSSRHVSQYFLFFQANPDMVVQLEPPLHKIPSDSTCSKLACDTTELAKADDKHEYSVKSQASSREISIDTLVDEHNDFESAGTFDWIAGVGDICNSGVRESNVHNNCIHRRNAEHGVPTSYPKAPRIRSPSVSVKPRYPQSNPNSKHIALRRHCDFWDTDADGIIYPWDIFNGFHRLGFHVLLCLWAAVTMPMCSSYSTQTSWLPHPLFAINLNNINRNRHGSTTGAYDMDAELDMRRFDAIFNKYAEGKDYLTQRTMYNVWQGQCCANDFFGWFAGGLECMFIYRCDWISKNAMTDFE